MRLIYNIVVVYGNLLKLYRSIRVDHASRIFPSFWILQEEISFGWKSVGNASEAEIFSTGLLSLVLPGVSKNRTFISINSGGATYKRERQYYPESCYQPHLDQRLKTELNNSRFLRLVFNVYMLYSTSHGNKNYPISCFPRSLFKNKLCEQKIHLGRVQYLLQYFN